MLGNRTFVWMWGPLLFWRAGDTFTTLALAVTVEGMFDRAGDLE